MAYNFATGSAQYLSVPSAVVVSNPVTLACWFNRSTTGAAMGLVAISNNTSTNFQQLSLSSSATNEILAVSNAGAPIVAALPYAATNQWDHGCAVFASDSSRQVFLNATGSTVQTNTVSVTGENVTSIGSRPAGAGIFGQFFSGLIADVGIWNVALTAAEIASLAKGMACDKVRPQSLVFYAPLARDLIDVRGGRAITNNNTATVASHPRIYQ
jgi:hypothetical protein